MAEELDRKLVEGLLKFSQAKGCALKGPATVTSAVNELLNNARKEGSELGKKNITIFLQEILKKADDLCNADDFNQICNIVESAETYIPERR